jgi:hypothetical protein
VDFPPGAGDSAPAGVSEESGLRARKWLGLVTGGGRRRACVRPRGSDPRTDGMVRRGTGWWSSATCHASRASWSTRPHRGVRGSMRARGRPKRRVRASRARRRPAERGGVACSCEAHRRLRYVRGGPAAACGRPAPTRRARCGGGAERG